jgi:GT2 family glycosyltransferase
MADPYASVVILSQNPPDSLISQLNDQTFQDFEIIIASDRGIVQAMNRALDRAKGEIFVRIDDDVELPKKWLEELLRPFKDHSRICGVTGPTFVPKERRQNRDSIRIAEKPGKFLKWMFDNGRYNPGGIYKCGSVSYDSNYEERCIVSDGWETQHLEGTNWAMKTALIKAVGGFDEKFDGVCEWYDTDVEQKVLKSFKTMEYKLLYNPNAHLYHLLEKGQHHSERFEMWGRIKNWLRFHRRHSKFHPKMLIWLAMMIGYGIWKRK